MSGVCGSAAWRVRPRRRLLEEADSASAGSTRGAAGSAAVCAGTVSEAGRRPRRRAGAGAAGASPATGASVSGVSVPDASALGLRGARRRMGLEASAVVGSAVVSAAGVREVPGGVSAGAASPATPLSDAGVRRVLGIIIFNSPCVKWCAVGDAAPIILDSRPAVKVRGKWQAGFGAEQANLKQISLLQCNFFRAAGSETIERQCDGSCG